MYYITNQTDEIIAADHALLTLLDAKDVRDLYKRVALGEIDFQLASPNKLLLSIDEQSTEYPVEQSTLSSILGELTIIHILEETAPATKEEEEVAAIFSPHVEQEDELFTLLEEEKSPVESEQPEEPAVLSEASDLLEEESIDLDIDRLLKEAEDESVADEEMLLSLDTAEPEAQPASKTAEEDELFELLLPDEAADTIDEIPEAIPAPEQSVTETEEDNTPIVIDIQKVSAMIGITPEDYNLFLNEYIDTAINLEKELQSPETEKRTAAIKTLSHLSDVLHLPKVNEIMEAIQTADTASQQSHIATLYATLSRLTTHQESSASPAETPQTEELSIGEAVPEPTAPSSEGFGTIDLSDVQPIHFDFQLEEAANDLSLPVELIEEFVNDFIAQAKVETPKMLEAYEKGELETIQKIGHLLKGAASNLRITPLADTLYEIQFCNDSSQLEPLIKNYWAHFLSFENQMNLISK